MTKNLIWLSFKIYMLYIRAVYPFVVIISQGNWVHHQRKKIVSAWWQHLTTNLNSFFNLYVAFLTLDQKTSNVIELVFSDYSYFEILLSILASEWLNYRWIFFFFFLSLWIRQINASTDFKIFFPISSWSSYCSSSYT